MRRGSRSPWTRERALLAAAVALAGEPAGAQTVTRGPYLQTGTPTSVVVRWRTSVPTGSSVRYGTVQGDPDLSVIDASPVTNHEIILTGLAPETVYYYGVGTASTTLVGGDAEHYFVTPPPAGARRAVRIWVLGDSGTANAGAAAVRDAYLAFTGPVHTDLWLMLGDNAYDDGTDAEYQAAVFDMYPQTLRTAVLWPTLGNHDGNSADSATQSGPYYDIFTLPAAGEAGGLATGTEAYYSFDFANVHFVCLDSHESDRSPDGPMLTWLREDLAATARDWIVAFWHHPPYSKGSHDSDAEGALIEMRENALPILEDAGVDLVLTGHSHSYERSFLLDGHYGLSSTLTGPMKKDAGDGRAEGNGAYAKSSVGGGHEGAVYAVAGCSGHTSGGDLDHPAMFLSLEVLGSLVLDVDGLELHATFLDDQGAVRDHFTIVKGTGTVPAPPGGLIASPAGEGELLLAWTDGSDDEAGFRIELSADGATWFQVAEVGAAVSYLHAGLSPATTYLSRVRAFNGSGVSPPSVPASGTTWSLGVGDLAEDEDTEAGTIGGSYHDTHDDDAAYEWIEEELSNGNPDDRYSFLEHTWIVDVTGGDVVRFELNAHKTPSSDGDNFVFAWSPNGSSWTNMLTISNTVDDGITRSFILPSTLDDPVYIRVRDSNESPGNQALDRIFVDRLVIRSEITEIPPAAPMNLAAAAAPGLRIDLSWVDFATTEEGFTVERSADSATWDEVVTLAANVTAYPDTDVLPLATYWYRVRAFNDFGESAYSQVAGATVLLGLSRAGPKPSRAEP